MTDRMIKWTGVVVALGLLTGGAALAAGGEKCAQCKFADCLKGLTEQKRAVANGYEKLATKYEKFILQDGRPIDEIDFSALANDSERQRALGDALKKHAAYQKDASSMIAEVGSPAACALTESAAPPKFEVDTDTFNLCTTEPVSLAAAQKTMPCQEVAALLDKHEAIHRQGCEKRKRSSQSWASTLDGVTKRLPGRLQTPAGNAREEAIAYRMEAAELQKLYELAIKNCKMTFKGVETSCTIPTPVGPMIAGQTIIEATACGDPITATWDLTTESFTRGVAGNSVSRDKPWQNDCVEKGSAIEKRREEAYRRRPAGAGGWMCVYDKGPPERITIRSFRPKMCSPGGEQTVTVELKRSTGSCVAKPKPAPPPPAPPPPVPEKPLVVG